MTGALFNGISWKYDCPGAAGSVMVLFCTLTGIIDLFGVAALSGGLAAEMLAPGLAGTYVVSSLGALFGVFLTPAGPTG